MGCCGEDDDPGKGGGGGLADEPDYGEGYAYEPDFKVRAEPQGQQVIRSLGQG